MKRILKRLLQISPYQMYEWGRNKRIHYRRNLEQAKLLTAYWNENSVKKLQIGSGSNYLDGWLNTDLNYKKCIAYLDAGRDYAFKDSTFDFIFSEHLFEHLNEVQQLKMLSESYRTLKTGGVLRIATPTVKFLFDIYRDPHAPENEEYVGWAMKHSQHLRLVREKITDRSYDHLLVINHFFKAWGHHMIHDVHSLKSMGKQAGFNKISEKSVGESNFRELQNLERHFNVIPKQMNVIETMVVEFQK